jgi:hypothetical protein
MAGKAGRVRNWKLGNLVLEIHLWQGNSDNFIKRKKKSSNKITVIWVKTSSN